jgi:hypothetical protein
LDDESTKEKLKNIFLADCNEQKSEDTIWDKFVKDWNKQQQKEQDNSSW